MVSGWSTGTSSLRSSFCRDSYKASASTSSSRLTWPVSASMITSVASTPTSATSNWVSISSKISSSISLAPTSRSARPLPKPLRVLPRPSFMRVQKPSPLSLSSAGSAWLSACGDGCGSAAGASTCAVAGGVTVGSGSPEALSCGAGAESVSFSSSASTPVNMRFQKPVFFSSGLGALSSSRETSSLMFSLIQSRRG